MLPLIKRYFPEFTEETLEKLHWAMSLHKEWNTKINLISRQDIEQIECHHYLHSLSLLKFVEFRDNVEVLDVGTGGGFPGLPLAIALPSVQFFLLDSIQKKLKVIEDIQKQLNLQNVHIIRSRIEDYAHQHDILTARAVTALPKFYQLVRKNVRKRILYLKGGDFEEELRALPVSYEVHRIYEKITEPYFETKKVVSLRFGMKNDEHFPSNTCL